MDNKEANQLVTIVVPVYKQFPNELELFSLKRCCKILGKYFFSIITHKGLDLKIYTTLLEEHQIQYKLSYFDKQYFIDLNGYNDLMVSSLFYEAFIKFEYILIYQLDAFVFSDKLIYWCNKGYDYIGAPWLNVKWVNRSKINKKLPLFSRWSFLFKMFMKKDGLVGNGGFSLRKVSTHIKYAKKYNLFFPSLNFNEDVFWGKYIAAKERDFRIPLLKEAIEFSIENDVPAALKILKNKLPFGCHGWNKKNITMWILFFKKAGVNVSDFDRFIDATIK